VEAGSKQPVLLVCPTSVVGNWHKEAARFTPQLPVMVHHGVARAKGAAFQAEAQKQAMVISSYALLQRDFEILEQVPWAGVLLDERRTSKTRRPSRRGLRGHSRQTTVSLSPARPSKQRR